MAPTKKPATRFGIPDFAAKDPEAPKDPGPAGADLMSAYLMSEAPPDPGAVPAPPAAAPNASMPGDAPTAVPRFGTMIDPTKLPGYQDPNAPVEDPLHRTMRLASSPDTLPQLSNDDAVRLQAASRDINAANLARNPMLGTTLQSQHGSTTSDQTTTGTNYSTTENESRSKSDAQSEQKATGTTQTVLSDDARESLLREQDIARQRGVVATRLGEVQSAAAAESAGKISEWANYQKEMALAQQRTAAEQQIALAKLEKDMQLQQSQYEKAAKEIDPSRLISGPKSWIAALAMGLGAYGAAMARTPNFAQQVINQALERDLEGQKIGLQAKKERMSMTQQILVDMRGRFQSDLAAKEATKAAMHGVFATQQEARAQALKGTEAGIRSQEEALKFAAEQQAGMTRAFQIESKTRTENNTTGESHTLGQEVGTANTFGTQTQKSHGTTVSGQSGSSYSPSTAGVAPVDLLKEAVDRANALVAFRKTGNGPTKADEAAQGKAEVTMRGLDSMQAAGHELTRLNQETNFLSRATGWTEASDEQKMAVYNYLAAKNLATTGQTITTQELERQTEAFFKNKWSGDALNRALGEDMRLGRFTIGSNIAFLQPKLKDQMYQRLRDAGYSERDMQEIISRKRNESEQAKGTRLGLTDLNAPAKPTQGIFGKFIDETLGSYR